jgi:hypothetical protein
MLKKKPNMIINHSHTEKNEEIESNDNKNVIFKYI